MPADAVEYSVIVPVFRARETLDALTARLVRFFEAAGRRFELIYVDDGSSDGSWERIAALAQADARIAGVQLMRNFGQHNATVEGLRHARGRWVLTMDEDLQHPPEEIGKLIDAQARTGADVVYGIPERRLDPWPRRLVSRAVMAIPRRVMGIRFDLSSFRLISARLAAELARTTRHDIILDVHLGWAAGRIEAVRIRQDPSLRGHSSYGTLRLVGLFFDLLCGYTVYPLRLAIALGFALSAAAVFVGCRAIYWKLTCDFDMEGYTSTFVAITFPSGLILVALGIIAEYLARISFQVFHKPQAVVRRTVTHGRDPDGADTGRGG